MTEAISGPRSRPSGLRYRLSGTGTGAGKLRSWTCTRTWTP